MVLDTARSLTHEEAINEGLNPFVDGSFDNYAVEAIIKGGGVGQTDHLGRPIISYRQYLDMTAMDMRMDNYVMRMSGPSGTGLIQASKYHKYFGEGYRPVEVVQRERAEARKRAAVLDEREARAPRPLVLDEDQIAVYWCKEKYADCPRFFDSRKALETHWGMTHEKVFKSKKEKAKEVLHGSEEV